MSLCESPLFWNTFGSALGLVKGVYDSMHVGRARAMADNPQLSAQ